MRILAVDTSSKVASVAILEDNKIRGEFTINQTLTHSEQLMPLIDRILQFLHLEISQMDLFAFSSGPGSFTGLRIGLASIKAMAYVLQKPVVPINTLDAMAMNIHPSQAYVCPLMDARNAQVYSAIYSPENNEYHRITDYMALDIHELAERAVSLNREFVFLGDGSRLYRQTFQSALGERCSFAIESNNYARATQVAILAGKKTLCGELSDAFSALPFYLRKSSAEQMLERKMVQEKNAKDIDSKA